MDPAILRRNFPSVDKDRIPNRLYRIHRVDQDFQHFATDRSGRFNPPGAPFLFGACYTSIESLGAYIEVFGDFPVVTTDEVARRCLTVILPPPDLLLADMTSAELLGTYRLDKRIETVDDVSIPQQWALKLHEAGFDGIWYAPRHDNTAGQQGFTLASVALFGDPDQQSRQLQEDSTSAIPRSLIEEAEKIFGIRVYPATAI